jgi:hypothetical protein
MNVIGLVLVDGPAVQSYGEVQGGTWTCQISPGRWVCCLEHTLCTTLRPIMELSISQLSDSTWLGSKMCENSLYGCGPGEYSIPFDLIVSSTPLYTLKGGLTLLNIRFFLRNLCTTSRFVVTMCAHLYYTVLILPHFSHTEIFTLDLSCCLF